MQNTLPIDGGGGGDPLGLTIMLWAIRIILPIAAAVLWFKFSSPDGKASSSPSPSLILKNEGIFGAFWSPQHPSYSVAQILRYRHEGNLSLERPLDITSLAPQERRQLGRRTDESEVHIHPSPAGGLLSAPYGGGGERDGPRPGTFRNGTRASLRREVKSPPQEPWLPTADASQLGVTPQTSLMPPTTDNLLGGQSMQMHQGGLISAAAYQKMKTSRRSFGSDDAPPHYTKSPTPSYPVSPTPLSLTHALSAAFTNKTLTPPEGVGATQQMSALRSLTPLLSSNREALFESPALHTSLHRPQTVVSQGAAVAQSAENTTHHINTTSPPLAGGLGVATSPPSFITANRDAVIELRKLLSTPSLEKATLVLERLRSQGMAIAPQTYTLLVTVAILCGCKDFALVCANDMAQAGYTLSEALQTKLQNMEPSKTHQAVSMATAMRSPDAIGGGGLNDGQTTKLMANAPVFTPCTVGVNSNGMGGGGDMSATTTSGIRNAVSASSNNNTTASGTTTSSSWLLPTQYSNTQGYSHANGHQHQHMMGGGTRVVPLTSKQHQQGPLAWLPPQNIRAQQTSPPMPDSSPPPSDLLPNRRPNNTSAPSSPFDTTSALQRAPPVTGEGGAVQFHKAVSQLHSGGGRKGARRTPEGGVGSNTKRPRSSWRKKSEASDMSAASTQQQRVME